MKKSTKDVESILSNPRSAMIVMAIPLFMSYLISNLQLYIDAMWCSGLGVDVMSAISLGNPIYWIIINLGIGLGVGASTAISRLIGSGDRPRANSIAAQSLVVAVLMSVIIAVILLPVSYQLAGILAGRDAGPMCGEYIMPFIVLCLPLILNGVIIGLLRSEGAAKKSMIMSVSASIFNMVLDPILIYVLDLGILGASLATVLSFSLAVVIGLYWYLNSRTYITLRFKDFHFKKNELYDVMYVAFPYTLSMILVSVMIIPQNAIVLECGGSDGMTSYYYPYRFIMLVSTVTVAISSSMLTVISVALGQKDVEKMNDAFTYSLKISLIISVFLGAFLFIFADPLIQTLTYSPGMEHLHGEMVKVLRMYSVVAIFITLIEVGSSLLQSLRCAQLVTVTLFIRELMFLGFFWVAAGISMDAIYWSLVLAQLLGGLMMMRFGVRSLNNTKKRMKSTVSTYDV